MNGGPENADGKVLTAMSNDTMYRACLALFALVLLATGCGEDPPSRERAAPFEAAIAAYLKQHSMGMKVAEVKSLTVEGDTATATVALQEAEGLYNLKVTWDFAFRRAPNGWIATSHSDSK